MTAKFKIFLIFISFLIIRTALWLSRSVPFSSVRGCGRFWGDTAAFCSSYLPAEFKSVGERCRLATILYPTPRSCRLLQGWGLAKGLRARARLQIIRSAT